jgi:hypothetical protein
VTILFSFTASDKESFSAPHIQLIKFLKQNLLGEMHLDAGKCPCLLTDPRRGKMQIVDIPEPWQQLATPMKENTGAPKGNP